MIEVLSLRSTALKMLGPIFYTDDYALVDTIVEQERIAEKDIWEITEIPFPDKPWRRKRFPLHSCYHRHIDGVIVIASGNFEIVANRSGGASVLVKLTGKPLAVPLTCPIECGWNGGRCYLIQKIVKVGPVYYAHQFSWTNSTGGEDTNGRATYRSYSYERYSDGSHCLKEGPSSSISRSISLADFRLYVDDVSEVGTFDGTQYGGVTSDWYVNVTEVVTENVESFLERLNIGVAGHMPMARDADKSLADRLLDRIRPDKVNLAEFAIGLTDLPHLARSGPEAIATIRDAVVRRRLKPRFPSLVWPKQPKPPKPPLTRAQYMNRLLDLNVGRIDRGMQREIDADLNVLDVTTRELGGMYLGYQYGLAPVPGDSLAIAEIADAISHAREEFELDLRTRDTFYRDGWLGYQAQQVNLAQRVLESLPTVESVLDANRPLRVASGMAFQNGDTLLEDAQRRLYACGLPSNHADIALILWELFPYSFVADWFVGIGDKLESMSKDEIWGTLPVDFSCRTVKAEKSINEAIMAIANDTDLTVTSDVLAISYDRHYSDKVITAPFEGGGPTYGQHWVEGSFLAFLRTSKR